MTRDIQNAADYIRNLAELEFFGFVSFKFEKGRLVHIRREENIKPTDLLSKIIRSLPETTGEATHDERPYR